MDDSSYQLMYWMVHFINRSSMVIDKVNVMGGKQDVDGYSKIM